MNSIIQLESLSRVYELGSVQIPALKNISLTVEEGEFIAVMGPSGSGKSTLLHVLGLLDQPTDGSYQLSGKEVARLSDDQRSGLRCRKIGFIFQSFNLFPMLDVRQNVEVPMLYSGMEAKARREKARMLLEEVGMSHRLDHRPDELSGGEMQRVAIARSLANDPKVILADEPTGNLDTKTAGAITEMLEELHKKGRTIIMVTHNDELGQKAGRIVRIRDGELEAAA